MITVGLAIEAYNISQKQNKLCENYWRSLMDGNKQVLPTILMALDHLDAQLEELRRYAFA